MCGGKPPDCEISNKTYCQAGDIEREISNVRRPADKPLMPFVERGKS